ncbi:MAG: pyridoxamine 5'-phosphate oxidase family protein [Bacteroidota bacterium]
MIQHEQFDKVKSLIDNIKTCMFVTQDGAKFKSRPFITVKVDEAGNIWFFTNKQEDAATELQTTSQVNLAYSHPDHQNYLSISGHAVLVNDSKKMDELWSPVLEAWFPKGKADNNLTLIKVTPNGAAYWDAEGSKIVNLVNNTGKAWSNNTDYEVEETAQISLT